LPNITSNCASNCASTINIYLIRPLE
jgi:hypothetical protein